MSTHDRIVAQNQPGSRRCQVDLLARSQTCSETFDDDRIAPLLRLPKKLPALRLTVMPYVGFPLSFRNFEHLLQERRIDAPRALSGSGGMRWGQCLLLISGIAGLIPFAITRPIQLFPALSFFLLSIRRAPCRFPAS